jgi:hypothetical protein
MKQSIVFLFMFAILLGGMAVAQEKGKSGKATYLIETKHTQEECLAALDAINEKDKNLLTKLNWGCPEGNHTGYMMVEAKSENEAVEDLPAELKEDMKVYKLVQVTPKQIEEYHKQSPQ